MPSSAAIIEGIDTLLNAWNTVRPGKSFAGMTLDEFNKNYVTPCHKARAEVAGKKNELKLAVHHRENVDMAANEAALAIVAAVKSDKEEDGENGDLYAAMGYVRKSDRKTGRRMPKAAVATQNK